MKCCGWGYVLRPPGAEPEEPGRSKGEVHIFNIYIIDSEKFQVDRLKPLGQVHYTKPVRTTDGRTDGWMDGRMDGRTDGQPPELEPPDLSPIPKLVLIPIDAISVEKKCARTDRVKPIWPSDYRQAGHKKIHYIK